MATTTVGRREMFTHSRQQATWKRQTCWQGGIWRVRGRFHVAESFCSPQTTQSRQSSKLLARIRCNCLVILETTGTSLQSWWSDKSPTPMADAFSVIAQACTTSYPHTYTQHTCTTSHTLHTSRSPPATNQGVIYTGLYWQVFGTIHICLNNHIDCKLRKSGVSL